MRVDIWYVISVMDFSWWKVAGEMVEEKASAVQRGEQGLVKTERTPNERNFKGNSKHIKYVFE